VKAVQVRLAARGNVGHELLGRLAGLLGRDHDRRAVRVVSAHKVDLAALHRFAETHPDVGLDVLHDVADVEIAVGVGQGGGDEELAGRFLKTVMGRHGGAVCRGIGDFRVYGPSLSVNFRPILESDHGDHRTTSPSPANRDRPEHGQRFRFHQDLKNLQVEGSDVSFDVELGYPPRARFPAFAKH
jgi:hypothetical protein